MTLRVLVLGGTGFIGRKVCTALMATDWATPIAASRHAANTTLPYAHVVCDATDAESVRRATGYADAIVDCMIGDADAMIANAKVTVEAAKERNLRVVYLSSMAAYGSATGLIDESAPLLGDLDDYARAKASAEQILASHANRVVLRPGIVYGPGSARWSVMIGNLLRMHRLGDLGANGDGICNLVHVDDVVAAIVASLDPHLATPQAFNLGGHQPITWNDFFIRYGMALGATPVPRIGNRRLKLETKLAAIPLKVLEKALGNTRARALGIPDAIPPSFMRLCRQELTLDTRKASNELGIAWTELNAGLDQTAAWFIRTFPKTAR